MIIQQLLDIRFSLYISFIHFEKALDGNIMEYEEYQEKNITIKRVIKGIRILVEIKRM